MARTVDGPCCVSDGGRVIHSRRRILTPLGDEQWARPSLTLRGEDLVALGRSQQTFKILTSSGILRPADWLPHVEMTGFTPKLHTLWREPQD